MSKLISFFFPKPVPVVVREIKFCKHDGTPLNITKEVIEYNQYDGTPTLYRVKRTCPKCGTEF